MKKEDKLKADFNDLIRKHTRLHIVFLVLGSGMFLYDLYFGVRFLTIFWMVWLVWQQWAYSNVIKRLRYRVSQLDLMKDLKTTDQYLKTARR